MTETPKQPDERVSDSRLEQVVGWMPPAYTVLPVHEALLWQCALDLRDCRAALAASDEMLRSSQIALRQAMEDRTSLRASIASCRAEIEALRTERGEWKLLTESAEFKLGEALAQLTEMEALRKERDAAKLDADLSWGCLAEIREVLEVAPCPCGKDHAGTPPMFYREWLISILAGLRDEIAALKARVLAWRPVVRAAVAVENAIDRICAVESCENPNQSDWECANEAINATRCGLRAAVDALGEEEKP